MKVLGLDPGITTGYALINEKGVLLESGNLCLDDLDESVLHVFRDDPEILVVEESVPLRGVGRLHRDLGEVIERLHQIFPTRTSIQPGTWKPVMKYFEIPRLYDGSRLSRHQVDAFCIANWYLIFKKGIILNARKDIDH